MSIIYLNYDHHEMKKHLKIMHLECADYLQLLSGNIIGSFIVFVC